MSKAKLTAGGLLAGALLIGAAVGALGARWASGEPRGERWNGHGREEFVDWLSRELELSADQRTEVAAVLERQHEALVALWREVRPRADEIRRETRQELRAVLTPEQQARHAELLEKMERERSTRIRLRKPE